MIDMIRPCYVVTIHEYDSRDKQDPRDRGCSVIENQKKDRWSAIYKLISKGWNSADLRYNVAQGIETSSGNFQDASRPSTLFFLHGSLRGPC